MSRPVVELVKTRPAETAMPIATVFAALIARLVGVEDTDTILYIALALSFVPAIVTWSVDLLRKKSDGGTTFQRPDENVSIITDTPPVTASSGISVEKKSVTKPKPVPKQPSDEK
jgi:hypothetical protein